MTLDNRYEILSVIKSGAMGCVYKARDIRLNSTVALKKMLSPSSDSADFKYLKQRFEEEARLLSQLHYRVLPKVTDYFTIIDPASDKPSYYLVMTFVEGMDLERVMRERGGMPIPMDEALAYFRQILGILRYLHSHEPVVIYWDLKPSNVIVRGSDIFLVDFGIACIFRPEVKGTAIGTPGYAPPEQYKGFSEPRSDIFSLGALMHYVVTGQNPEDPSKQYFSFNSARQINPQVPEHVSNTIMAMLEVIIDKRPESAEQVLDMLEKPQRKPGMITRIITACVAFLIAAVFLGFFIINYQREELFFNKGESTVNEVPIDKSREEAKEKLAEMNLQFYGANGVSKN